MSRGNSTWYRQALRGSTSLTKFNPFRRCDDDDDQFTRPISDTDTGAFGKEERKRLILSPRCPRTYNPHWLGLSFILKKQIGWLIYFGHFRKASTRVKKGVTECISYCWCEYRIYGVALPGHLNKNPKKTCQSQLNDGLIKTMRRASRT